MTQNSSSHITDPLLFLLLFGLCQVASCAQRQLQISPGRGDVQTGPVIHGQVSQTRSPCQQGCPLRRAVRSALCQKPLWWGKELNTQAWSFMCLGKKKNCTFFCLSNMYSLAFQAYRWCIEAMKEITVGLPVKVVVDVLRQASKVFL